MVYGLSRSEMDFIENMPEYLLPSVKSAKVFFKNAKKPIRIIVVSSKRYDSLGFPENSDGINIQFPDGHFVIFVRESDETHIDEVIQHEMDEIGIKIRLLHKSEYGVNAHKKTKLMERKRKKAKYLEWK